jgi:thioesterase domain-containing protein
MGGLPGFEIAQQLLRRGEKIESVIHISPIMERDWEYLESERDLELRAAHDFVFLADKLMGIKLPVDFDAMRASKDKMAYLLEQAIAHDCLPSDLEMEGFQRRVNVYRANLNAMRNYEPTDIRPCKIRVLLISNRGDRARLDFDSVYTAYLSRVAPEDIEVTRVDADPVSFINGKEPDLGITARALEQVMAKP